MWVGSPGDVAGLVRDLRRQRGLTQAELAADVGVGRRFIIDLESGKDSVQLGLTLRTLRSLGVRLDVNSRDGAEAPAIASSVDLDTVIDSHRRAS